LVARRAATSSVLSTKPLVCPGLGTSFCAANGTVRRRPKRRLIIPDYQRRGVASALTDHPLDHIRQCGRDIAAVETGGDAGHAAARVAYEALGFTVLPVSDTSRGSTERPRRRSSAISEPDPGIRSLPQRRPLLRLVVQDRAGTGTLRPRLAVIDVGRVVKRNDARLVKLESAPSKRGRGRTSYRLLHARCRRPAVTRCPHSDQCRESSCSIDLLLSTRPCPRSTPVNPETFGMRLRGQESPPAGISPRMGGRERIRTRAIRLPPASSPPPDWERDYGRLVATSASRTQHSRTASSSKSARRS
jgi:hypothetical protein